MDALAPDPNDTGCHDLGFHELYTRWLQYAAFLPMFRSHGTDVAREAWRFAEPFYTAIVQAIRWRYRLLPFLYSLAAAVTRDSQSMIRAVALEFPHDLRTHSLDDQFLLGHSLLICPVTQPMFFAANSTPIANAAQSRTVYLPEGQAWFNFWTSEPHSGGQTITAAAPLDQIPVFARAGSIVPLGPVMQYVRRDPRTPPMNSASTPAPTQTSSSTKTTATTYAYEEGAFAEIKLSWTQQPRRASHLRAQRHLPRPHRTASAQHHLPLPVRLRLPHHHLHRPGNYHPK